MAKEPQRRIVMRAKIEADTWRDLYGHLKNIVTKMAMHDEYRLSKHSVSGGYSSGHIIIVDEDGAMDHDKWAADLDAWLEERRQSEQSS